MKSLLIILICFVIAETALAQNKNNATSTGEPRYKILLKGINLTGGIPTDSFASVINKSYNDTLFISPSEGESHLNIISFAITIFPKGKDASTFYSDGILKGYLYRELKWCHKGDVVYIDNVWFIENGLRKKQSGFVFLLQ